MRFFSGGKIYFDEEVGKGKKMFSSTGWYWT